MKCKLLILCIVCISSVATGCHPKPKQEEVASAYPKATLDRIVKLAESGPSGISDSDLQWGLDLTKKNLDDLDAERNPVASDMDPVVGRLAVSALIPQKKRDPGPKYWSAYKDIGLRLMKFKRGRTGIPLQGIIIASYRHDRSVMEAIKPFEIDKDRFTREKAAEAITRLSQY